MEAVTEKVLVEKIQSQERRIALLEQELLTARKASVDAMLGQLRLRETVLVHVGKDADAFKEKLAQDYGSDMALHVAKHLFNMNNAPVPIECRDTMLNAFNHGMNRW